MHLSIKLCSKQLSLHSLLTKKPDVEIILCQQVQVNVFVKEFIEKTRQYVHHVHLARWQDEKFRICKDTFPRGTNVYNMSAKKIIVIVNIMGEIL